MFFQILGAIAEFEHALMSERTRDGLAAARARGRTGGQKPKLGPLQAQLARQMYDEIEEHGKRRYTGGQIAAEFGVTRPIICPAPHQDDLIASPRLTRNYVKGSTLDILSSGQGSISNNQTGMREVYRGSKAALNMFMRSFAARQPEPSRTMLVIAPGWIRTDLGGPDAPLSIQESIPTLVDVMLSQKGNPGLQFLDRLGRTVPW